MERLLFAYIAIMAVMIEGDNADFVKIDLEKYADFVKSEYEKHSDFVKNERKNMSIL